MKVRWGLLFLAWVMIHIGATGSDKAKDGSSSRSRSSNAGLGPQGFVSDSIVKFFSSRKTGKELMEEKKNKAPEKVGQSQPASPTPGAGTTAGTGKATRLKPGYAPPPPVPRVSVPQIREEIQKILELNQKIKSVQGGRSQQLQRVQEQARIHQKILDEMETSQRQAAVPKMPAKDILLAQEKLRIIHDETQRNAQMIDEIQSVSASTVAKPLPKAAPKTKTSAL